MSTLLLTYDLNAERKKKGDYGGFYKVRDGYDFVKLSESSYAINTIETPETVYNKLRKHMDENDHVYVINLKKLYFGFGPKTVNTWLDKNLPL